MLATQWFEPNLGQAEASIRFVAHTPRMTAALSHGGQATFLHRGYTGDRPPVKLHFEGARRASPAQPLDPQPGVTAYLAGPRENHLHNIPHYSRVRFEELYSGVDLVYYFSGDALEYDLVLEPGARPENIALRFEGADEVKLTDSGDLLLRHPAADLIHRAPRVFQTQNGRRVEIPARYRLKGDRVSVILDRYDPALPVTIDPVIAFASYVGGTGLDGINDITVDSAGAIYVVGHVNRAAYTPPASAPRAQGKVAFLAKYVSDATGKVQMSYFAILNGPGTAKDAVKVGLDSQNNVYVLGAAVNDNICRGADNKFWIKKFAASGQSVVPEYHACPAGHAQVTDMAVDPDGSVYLAGLLTPGNFTEKHGITFPFGIFKDGFILKVNRQATAYDKVGIDWATRVGAPKTDEIKAIALGPGGDIFVAGYTLDDDFPVLKPWVAVQPDPVNSQGFFMRLSQPRLNTNPVTPVKIVYSTLVGGNGGDEATAIAVDSIGNPYVGGSSSSTNFPQRHYIPLEVPAAGMLWNAFLVKFPVPGAGNLLPEFATLFGAANGHSKITSIALDDSGRVYAAGEAPGYKFKEVRPLPGVPPMDNIARPVPFIARFFHSSPEAELELEFSSTLGGMDDNLSEIHTNHAEFGSRRQTR